MASISAVYGNNFQAESVLNHSTNIVNLFSTNLANKEFAFSISSCELWTKDSLSQDIIANLIRAVQTKNPSLRLTHINKKSPYINMFPYIYTTPAEYFILTDLRERHFFSIYITPEKMDVF